MRVVALVADLMDGSRITAALPDVELVRHPGAVAGAAVVIVDLGRYGDAVATVRDAAPEARIVAYGSHVDQEALDRAVAAGADVVMPRSRFFRDPAAAVRPPP